ncbi:MAG: T9SS type A sorting domain-containing protein [Chitinophagaceae bacterium]|nr:T9SS type A sorting domain-containing protein [Chitinophagaceae bacterium]
MKQNFKKLLFVVLAFLSFGSSAIAQGTLEMTLQGNETGNQGYSIAPVPVTFLNDALNAPANTIYSTYSPTLTATMSFRNQLYSTQLSNTSTTVPGLMFGARTTASVGPNNQQAVGSCTIYDVFGAEIPAGRVQNGMYTSSPTATPVTNYQSGGRGAGLDVQALTNATNTNGDPDANFGVALYSTVEPLFDINAPKDGRFLYGELVINFNRPVKNPVVHIGGMGGSYTFQPIGGGPIQISYFTTELELVNTGVTSTFMAGNEYFNVAGNNVLNSSTTPNAGSIDDGSTTNGFNNYGAASGSVRINGMVQELVYKVYVRGAAASNFNFSKSQVDITASNRDPFNGDLWYLAVSLDKPTQQISGYVFNDKDGLTDNNINQSAGVANPKTNVGGTLYANLLSGGVVVATTPIAPDGSYLFDNVAVGTYTVQLSTNQGVVKQPSPATVLPAGWVNTGEFIGNTAGNDGSVNGTSATVTVNASDIKTEVNFGIERVPESVDFLRVIPPPIVGTVMTLSPISNLPVLTGSDPEDMPTSNVLTGKSVQITTLPNNAILKYNGTVINAGDIISNFNPDNFTITFTGPAQASTQFNYAYVDAAGIADPTPALYKLIWSGGPLAITISEFTAGKNNCTANLVWKTATEINSDKFEAEISTNNGTVYSKVGTVNAAGVNGKTYQFNYPMQTGVQYYFRLKLIDKDGSYKYSEVRILSCTDGKSIITIAPNPVIDRFSIAGMENGKNTVVVIAANGQIVKTQVIPQNQGYVNIANFASGMYSVKVISEKGNITVGKIIKN